MNVESLREFCLSLPQVTECFPFDEWVLVFKVICDCIVHAYSEVLKKLPKIKREPLSELLEAWKQKK